VSQLIPLRYSYQRVCHREVCGAWPFPFRSRAASNDVCIEYRTSRHFVYYRLYSPLHSFAMFSVIVCLFLYLGLLIAAEPLGGQSHHISHQHRHARSDQKRGLYREKFSVKQIENPKFKSSKWSSGPAALLQAHLMHNIPLTSAIVNAPSALKNLKGSAIAIPNPSNYDHEYLVPVTIGSVTPQTLNLDLDTGSSDLWVPYPPMLDMNADHLSWVFSNSTPTAQSTGHVVYEPNTCSTAGCAKLIAGETWGILYSDQSTSSGIVYNDSVTIGGISVPYQAVEAAKQVSSSFTSDTASSGLIGISFSTLNTYRPKQQSTWFDNIKSSLDTQVWTANLKKAAPGTYNFGYIDGTSYTGSITYTPVNTAKGFWEFISSGYAFGTSAFKVTAIDAIVDTGTTLLLLPSAILTAYWAQVKYAYLETSFGAYIYPCSATPPLHFWGWELSRRCAGNLYKLWTGGLVLVLWWNTKPGRELVQYLWGYLTQGATWGL
jgi:hypothetical protein